MMSKRKAQEREMLQKLLSVVTSYETTKIIRTFYLLTLFFLAIICVAVFAHGSDNLKQCSLQVLPRLFDGNNALNFEAVPTHLVHGVKLAGQTLIPTYDLIVGHINGPLVKKNACGDTKLSIFSFIILIILAKFILHYPLLLYRFIKCKIFRDNDQDPLFLKHRSIIVFASLLVSYAYSNPFYLTPILIVFLFKKWESRHRFNRVILKKGRVKKLSKAVNFAKLDRHATKVTSLPIVSITALVNKLLKNANNDIEKTYLIYRWITANIEYDTDAYFSNNLDKSYLTADVFMRRKAVCSGYANLFVDMMKLGGVTAVYITGKAKGFSYEVTGGESGHAWCGVLLQNEWHLVDPTWDAGALDSRSHKFIFSDGPYNYFLLNPEAFMIKHTPDELNFGFR